MRAWTLFGFDAETSEATTAVGFLVVDENGHAFASIPDADWPQWDGMVQEAADDDAVNDTTVDGFLEDVCNGISMAAEPIAPAEFDADQPLHDVAADLVDGWLLSLVN